MFQMYALAFFKSVYASSQDSPSHVSASLHSVVSSDITDKESISSCDISNLSNISRSSNYAWNSVQQTSNHYVQYQRKYKVNNLEHNILVSQPQHTKYMYVLALRKNA